MRTFTGVFAGITDLAVLPLFGIAIFFKHRRSAAAVHEVRVKRLERVKKQARLSGRLISDDGQDMGSAGGEGGSGDAAAAAGAEAPATEPFDAESY